MPLIEISGNVVDKADNSGLPGVNCKIENTTKGFSTDFDGNLKTSINLSPSPYTFLFSFIGYNTKTIEKQITDATTTLDFGTIELEEQSEELEEFEVISSKVKGKVVDQATKKNISGAKIIASGSLGSTTSEPSGEFEIDIQYTKSQIPFSVEISAQNYNSSTAALFNGDNTKKSTLGIIELTPIVTSVEEEEMKAEDYTEEQINLLKGEIDKGFVATQLEKLLNKIKKLLIPAILAILAKFGISQISKIKNKTNVTPQDLMDIGASCPASIQELEGIIDRKNKLTKQINNLYSGIEKIDNFIKPLNTLIDSTKNIAIPGAKIGFQIPANIPSTSVSPNPVGPILKLKDILDGLEDLIDATSPKIGQSLFQLNFLKSNVGTVITLLNILDMMIGKCADELGLEQEDENETTTTNPFQEQISEELLALTQEQEKQGSPVVKSVNGFTMDVITIEGVTIGGLNRRQAIAKNPSGIIMLRGEPSFSSVDQILIDELSFFIKQNNLKAE